MVAEKSLGIKALCWDFGLLGRKVRGSLGYVSADLRGAQQRCLGWVCQPGSWLCGSAWVDTQVRLSENVGRADCRTP